MERDFTHAPINRLRMFGGANGNKISIKYQDENYMLKFPPKGKVDSEMSYVNSCISEYVACHIFQSLGIDTQETLLGKYGNKITVACKDLEVDGFVLKEFAHLKNTVIDSEQNGYGTEISDVLMTIQEQQIFSPDELEKRFWEIFVGDALLGNFDRHNGNWGFLINESTGQVKLAPVFDCGSCLYPQLDEKAMVHVLENRDEIEKRLFVFPNSALKQEDKKINYYQFLITTDNKACQSALIDIGSKVNLEKINLIIDNTPYISDIHKFFLKTMVAERKEQIIDKAVERVQKLNETKTKRKDELER